MLIRPGRVSGEATKTVNYKFCHGTVVDDGEEHLKDLLPK
jgi:hypothetical protein